MTNYFGSKGSSSGGIASPFYPLKPQLNPWTTATQLSTHLTCWRAGAANNAMTRAGSGTSIILRNLSTSTDIATTDYTTLLASSVQFPPFTYSSTDQCFYFMLTASSGGACLLVKMSDTTGVMTAIGSSFVPTTITNWGRTNSYNVNSNGQIYLDAISGHIKYIYNGKYHLINKTTGAIVSQDNVVSVGSQSTKGFSYFTSDGVYATDAQTNPYSYTGGGYTPVILHASGYLDSKIVPINMLGTLVFSSVVATIDTDKLVVGSYPDSTGGFNGRPSVVLRSDYDQYISSIFTYYTTA